MTEAPAPPLWGFSASYRTPSGNMSHVSGVVRCHSHETTDRVIQEIQRNPRRKYVDKLDIYSRRLIPEKSYS